MYDVSKAKKSATNMERRQEKKMQFNKLLIFKYSLADYKKTDSRQHEYVPVIIAYIDRENNWKTIHELEEKKKLYTQ
jgi:uncharacterized protein YggL (DUF469 family)